MFLRTNASAFAYADLSSTVLIVDTVVVAAAMQMMNHNYDPLTPQSQTRTAVDTAGVIDEDPQEAMKAQTVALHYCPPSPFQMQTNGMGSHGGDTR